jgi:hypothetical protein
MTILKSIIIIVFMVALSGCAKKEQIVVIDRQLKPGLEYTQTANISNRLLVQKHSEDEEAVVLQDANNGLRATQTILTGQVTIPGEFGIKLKVDNYKVLGTEESTVDFKAITGHADYKTQSQLINLRDLEYDTTATDDANIMAGQYFPFILMQMESTLQDSVLHMSRGQFYNVSQRQDQQLGPYTVSWNEVSTYTLDKVDEHSAHFSISRNVEPIESSEQINISAEGSGKMVFDLDHSYVRLSSSDSRMTITISNGDTKFVASSASKVNVITEIK